MIRGASSQTRRHQHLASLLLSLVHPDVIPLMLSYEVTIEFEFRRSYGGQAGSEDGEMNQPQGLVLHGEELFILDTGNGRVQVFHQGTGRFLRKWGQRGREDGEFIQPHAAAIAFNDQTVEEEIFIGSRGAVQVFRLSDSQFLRRLSSIDAFGVAVVGEEIFLSRSSKVDVLAKSDGKPLKVVQHGALDSPGKLFAESDHNHLFVANTAKDQIQLLDVRTGQLLRVYQGRELKSSTVGKQLNWPRAVVAHGDQVIVGDTCNNRLVIFDRSTGEMIRETKGSRFRRSLLSLPSDLAINHLHQLFVGDTGHNRVVVFE